MKYQVMRIEEDLDFGCEEREENHEPQVIVILKDAACHGRCCFER